MAYTVKDENTVTLDTGENVYYTVTRERLANGEGIAFTASAVWVDDDGNMHEDDSGHIISVTTFRADPRIIAELGEEGIARALALTVLGEDQTDIPFSEGFRQNVNIRTHILAANASSTKLNTLL